jgi:hypothetical protein
MRKRLAILLLAIASAAGCVSRVSGQLPAPMPMPIQPGQPVQPVPVTLRAPAELEQMLQSIALYPDPLISEILPAATQPAEIVLADRYVSSGGDPAGIDFQPWDPSVKALARYPSLLRWLDDNLTWTTQVGQAFLYQQADVMDAIQHLRAQAMALGNLQSNAEQSVVVENGMIEILPANPQVVYVPVYQPELVYVQPAPQPDVYFSYGPALVIGPWLNHDFDWWHHDIMVWNRAHPRPEDWWRRRDHEAYARQAPVWRPENHHTWSGTERQARGWGSEWSGASVPNNRQEGRGEGGQRPREQPQYRPATPEPAAQPQVSPARPVPRTIPSRSPEPAAQVPRQAAPPPQTRVLPPQTTVPPAPVRPAPPANSGRISRSAPEPRSSVVARPTISAPASTGALVGVHSAPETRQYSIRGQESRQALSPRPAPTASAPAPARAAPAPPPSRAPAPAPAQERNRR